MEALLAELRPLLSDECHAPSDDGTLPSCSSKFACTDWEELLRLLQQYPGGLTRAVLLTQLQQTLGNLGSPEGRRGKRPTRRTGYHQQQQQQQQQAGSKDQLPGSIQLAACLPRRHMPATDVVVQARVVGVCRGTSSGGVALQLSDDSTGDAGHVDMLLHSAHTWMLEGAAPLLAAGRVLRAATTWCRLVGCDTLPPLLPSSALTLCLDEQEWAAALAAPAAVLPGGGAVYTPAQLVAGGTAALGSSGCPLNGWLHAEVVALGQESIGAGCPDAAASRSWLTRSVLLRDAADPAGTTLRWLLLDGATQYAKLLRPGELLLLHRPTVRCSSQHADPAQGSPPELLLQSDGQQQLLLLVLLRDAGGPQPAPPHTMAQTCCSPEAAGLTGPPGAPGGDRVTLCGTVRGIELQRLHHLDHDGAAPCCSLQCQLLSGGDWLDVIITLAQEEDGHATRLLLQQLRDGHVLLLTRCSRAGAAQQGGAVLMEWRGGAGAAVVNLSRLPALLGTPDLQVSVPLSALHAVKGAAGCGAGADHPPGPLFLRACRIAATGAVPQQLHAVCGRPVAAAETEGSCMGGGSDLMWCSFCRERAVDVEDGLSGWVELVSDTCDVTGSTNDQERVRLTLDAAAWRDVLGSLPGMELPHMPHTQQCSRAAALGTCLLGRLMTAACVYYTHECGWSVAMCRLGSAGE